MISAIAKIPSDPGYLKPILQAALDGLRPQSGGKPAAPTFWRG